MTPREYVSRITVEYELPPDVSEIQCLFDDCLKPVAFAMTEFHDQYAYACEEHGRAVIAVIKEAFDASR